MEGTATRGATERLHAVPGPATQDLTALTRLAMRVLGPSPAPQTARQAQQILDSVRALGRELTPTEHRRVIERLETL